MRQHGSAARIRINEIRNRCAGKLGMLSERKPLQPYLNAEPEFAECVKSRFIPEETHELHSRATRLPARHEMKLALSLGIRLQHALARRTRKKFPPAALCAAATFAFYVPFSTSASPAYPTWETPPGWADARGGSGGRVIRVTTLALQGPGSLAAALRANGPRVIVFTVAGEIDLGGKSLLVERPYLTLAGETTPSPGITIKNGGIEINANDVIVRHLKSGRVPARARDKADGKSTGWRWEVTRTM